MSAQFADHDKALVFKKKRFRGQQLKFKKEAWKYVLFPNEMEYSHNQSPVASMQGQLQYFINLLKAYHKD